MFEFLRCRHAGSSSLRAHLVLEFPLCHQRVERGVVPPSRAHVARGQGAGLNLVFWPIETLTRMSMRIETWTSRRRTSYARQHFRKSERRLLFPHRRRPISPLSQVQNYQYATSQLAQTTIRSVVGQFELDEILAQLRLKSMPSLQSFSIRKTEPWASRSAKLK